MGNMCTEKEGDPTVYQRKGSKKNVLNSNFHQVENERIAEIKEFLTLTSQNTESFYCGETSGAKIISMNNVQKSITDFKVVRGLGRGAFGQVYMVKDSSKDLFYAMKIIPKQRITTQQEKIHTLSERYILQAMDHPFIVKLHYAFQTSHKLYLLVDLMPGGELFYLLRRNEKFSEEVTRFYLAEILSALEYLHSRNIIYRDLKPENILLDQEGHIKLTDFGLSKVCYSPNQMAYSVCGTPEYIAPQIIQGKGYNQSADWFSFGSLMYDMLTGKPPFYSKNKHQILKKIVSKPVPIPQDLSSNAKSLLKSLFKIKPKERIGSKFDAQQIKSHPFFANVNFSQIEARTVKPPITFKENAVNEDGFDDNMLDPVSNSMLDEKTLREKGIGFDGFTYYKQDILSPERENIPETGHLQQQANEDQIMMVIDKDCLCTSQDNKQQGISFQE